MFQSGNLKKIEKAFKYIKDETIEIYGDDALASAFENSFVDAIERAANDKMLHELNNNKHRANVIQKAINELVQLEEKGMEFKVALYNESDVVRI